MAEFAIRKAAPRHYDGILECLAAAFEPYRNAYTPAAFADTILSLDALTERAETMTILVAVTREDGVLGTIAYRTIPCSTARCERFPSVLEDGTPVITRIRFMGETTFKGHIRGMAVLPTHHGQGIAEELLAAAEDEMLQKPVKMVTLETTEPLSRAQRFYEKHGYQPSGVERDFFGMRLIELRKELTPIDTKR